MSGERNYPAAASKTQTAGRTEKYGTRPDRPVTSPAFTIVGHDGHPRGGFQWRNTDGSTTRLTLDELAVLQSFPAHLPAPVERPNMKTLRALDLFAGTGWGVACRWLGIQEMGVEIMPEACATREANGMPTIYHDVWEGLEGDLYVPAYDILIASPPCQTFSLAGKGAGRAALDDVLEAIELHAYKDPAQLREFGETHDDRTALVLTPLAHVWRDRPTYVAFEQVPTVLPVWEACAGVMRDMGYSVWVGNLQAEQYGVPQTRKRAILMARLDGDVTPPTPTHSRYYSRDPKRLDPGVLPWVSMAEALGWGAKDQPSHTVVAGVHGPTDRWASGGNSIRKALDAKIGTDAWIDKPDQEVDGRTKYGQRFDVEHVAALQSYPIGRGLTDRPSPTITGGGTETGGAEPIAKLARYTTSPGWQGSTDRLNPKETATLQSYPPFTFHGTKSKQFLQIGNAVPPLLAKAVLQTLTSPAPTGGAYLLEEGAA